MGEANPSDEGILSSCRKSYQDHFKAETDLLAKSSTYPKEELYQHINKHNILLNSMAGLTTPVSQKWIDFAKNWLTQHIPNTDFRYKNMMPFPVATPTSGTSPSRSSTRDSMTSTSFSLTSCSS